MFTLKDFTSTDKSIVLKREEIYLLLNYVFVYTQCWPHIP